MNLEEFLAAAERDVRERWPELAPLLTGEIRSKRFPKHVESLGLLEELAEVRGGELALAFLCFRGDARAILRFDEEFLSRIPEKLRRIDSSESFAGEIVQRTRERLLVAQPGSGDGSGRSRMADYSGRGSLLGWVQVAASRLALNYRRDEKVSRHVDAEDFDLIGATEDPALQLIKQRHQPDFRSAFGDAIAALTDDDRELLRLHFVDGLTLGQIGKLDGVDKSTVSRRLTSVRDVLFADTRRRLEARLGLTHSEFESLMNVIQSQLHLSIERILRN